MLELLRSIDLIILIMVAILLCGLISMGFLWSIHRDARRIRLKIEDPLFIMQEHSLWHEAVKDSVEDHTTHRRS